MSRDIAGTNRKFTSNGVSYRIAADANFTETITAFENSMIASSGQAMRKMVKRVPSREGIVLLTNADERENLIADSESLDLGKFSYTNAAGDEYKCEGTIEIENNETEENRTTCQIHPVDRWTKI
ncbi:MAG: hypothetical protein ACTSPB_12895 [Candidatus Thorarchaeota archaeon]